MRTTLTRIILFAQDVSLLKNFYITHFKFELLQQIQNEWVVLKAGAIEMAFHKIGNDYETEEGKPFKAESNTKLVFEIKEDLTSLWQELINKGVALREIKSFPGFDYLLCDGEDPEGNVFQLAQKLIR